MKWLDRLENCVNYIEQNLSGEINMDVLAKKACLSKLYFYRMFMYVTGVPISEYIRRRRMTIAAQQLVNTGCKVIDLALDLGYSSPEAFSRAFKSVHGISPAEAAAGNHALKAFPQIYFQIKIKGDIAMNYRIVKKDAFDLLGVVKSFSSKDGEGFIQIPAFWAEFNKNTCAKLSTYSTDKKIFGVCMNYDSKYDKFDYAICVPFNGNKAEEFNVISIPASTWAIFDVVGPMPKAIQEVTTRIYSEWLPATNYELTDGPQMELYYEGDVTSDDYRSEVWMPINADN